MCEGQTDCCLARILSLHDDYRSEKSGLEKLFEKRGHEVVFIPKFHCELNPIEMVSLSLPLPLSLVYDAMLMSPLYSIGDG
jgi:hypothetical protein